VVVDRVVEFLRRGLLPDLDVAVQRAEFPGVRGPAARRVDGPVLRGGHQPTGRVRRHPGARPLLQRGEQGILGVLLGQAQVLGDPGQPGDQPG
jgi:hypothetical protein